MTARTFLPCFALSLAIIAAATTAQTQPAATASSAEPAGKPTHYLIGDDGPGNNDQIANANTKGRPELAGLGDDTTTGISSAGKEETVHTFGWYMTKFVVETKAKGATPVRLTMIPHNAWTGGAGGRGRAGAATAPRRQRPRRRRRRPGLPSRPSSGVGKSTRS